MTAQTIVGNFKNILAQKYCCFEGRAGRAEFWQWFLAVFIISFVLGIVESLIGIDGVLSGLFWLAVLLPDLGVTARRLHDTGKSGWWQLLCVTGIGALIVLIMCIPEGDAGENKYGAAASCGCCCGGAAEEKKEE